MEEDVLDEEEVILYDLLTPYQWPESITIEAANVSPSLWKVLAILAKGSSQFVAQKILHPFRSTGGLPASVVELVSAKISWHLAITSDGSTLAVLRDDCVEIWKAEDGFKKAAFSFKVECSPWPQWRKVVWDGGGSLLAVASGYGSVTVLSLMEGQQLCTLLNRSVGPDSDKTVPPHALSEMAFLPPHVLGHSSTYPLLAVLEYGGQLSTFMIRFSAEGPPLQLHTFSFSDQYPYGVGSMLWHERLNVLILAGPNQENEGEPLVSLWRPLDSAPYWSDTGRHEREKPTHWMKSSKRFEKTMVLCMSLSPSDKLLATVDVSGMVYIWELPSCNLKKSWSAHDLSADESHAVKGQPKVVDVCWWSEDALVLMDTTGQVTVVSLQSLKLLLGEHSETGSCIVSTQKGQLLMLQCETREQRRKLHSLELQSEVVLKEEKDEEEEKEEDEGETDEEERGEMKGDDEEKPAISRVCTNFMKQVLFFLTDMERFHPDAKQPRLVMKAYKLTCVEEIPPEVYYNRKMEAEQYEEALMLAQQYGLDCDQVYQRQWQSNPHSVDSIHNYLSKVSNTLWVLQECVSCMPDSYDTANELLAFGLDRTSFRMLKEAGCEDNFDSVEDGDVTSDVSLDKIKGSISTWKQLNAAQMTICQHRHALLNYKDRISTYEDMLSSHDDFNPDFFKYFRSCNLVQITVDYARSGDSKTVETLFTHHSGILSPHRLAILSNFPETLSPDEYQSLLPSLSPDGRIESQIMVHREVDWIETPPIRRLCCLPEEAHSNSGEYLYEENPGWKKYLSPGSADVLSDWYLERAVEIEELSGQVSNSLDLVQLGKQKGVQGLEIMCHQLLTLHTLIYVCDGDNNLNLTQLWDMNNLNILHLMTKGFVGSEFITHVCQRWVPFLERLEELHAGEGRKLVENYLVNLSHNDLEPCLAVLQQSCGKGSACSFPPVIKDCAERMNLALLCTYSCERTDQLDVASKIVECLPVRPEGLFEETATLHNRIDKLEDHLNASEILCGYGIHKPIHYIKDIENNEEESLLLMKKVIKSVSKQPPPISQGTWVKVLKDILTLQSCVIACAKEITCYEVFTSNLLCSGQVGNIELACHLLTVDDTTPEEASSIFDYRLSYEVSLDLVVKASQEYFNAAVSVDDADMTLAKACLDLFPTCPPQVQAEHNLISCVSILEQLGVKILPVQLRLCTNALDIVKDVLNSSPSTYLQHDKIIQLVSLLGWSRSDGGEETCENKKLSALEGHSEVLISMTAIERKDYKFAGVLCNKLMDGPFPPAWKICRCLATNIMFQDLEAKLVLINFAVTHCPVDIITNILKERQLIEAQLLRRKCDDAIGSYGGSVQQLVGEKMQGVVSTTAGSMHQLLSKYRSVEQNIPEKFHLQVVLLESVQWLKSAVEQYCQQKPTSLKFVLHPFYGHTQKISWSTTGYNSIPTSFLLQSSLLRVLKLVEHSFKLPSDDYTEAIVGMGREYLTLDVHLLSISLCLLKVTEWNQIFLQVPADSLNFHLCSHCVCVQLISVVIKRLLGCIHMPYEIIRFVYTHVSRNNLSQWPKMYHFHLNQVLYYQEMAANVAQAKVLHGLGLGIDIQRFAGDVKFRCSSILQFCRTQSRKQFDSALVLAKRLNAVAAQKQLEQWKVTQELLLDPQQTLLSLQSKTFPNLNGTDLDMLLLYYTILQECTSHGGTCEDCIDVQTHLRLIKKFKSAAPGLDYIQLIRGDDHHNVLATVLTERNVHVVAELAPDILWEDDSLSASQVYSIFSQKLFWNAEDCMNAGKWMMNLRSCFKYLKHLNSHQFYQFILEVLFCDKGTKLLFSTRAQLVELADDFSQREVNPTEDMSKEQLHQQLMLCCQHLLCLNEFTLSVPPNIDENTWRDALRDLDISMLKPELLQSCCKQLLTSGVSLSEIQRLLSLPSVKGFTYTLGDVVKGVLREQLMICRSSLSIVGSVRRIMQSVHHHESTGKVLVGTKDVLDVVKPIFEDESISADFKGALMGLAEEFLILENEDKALLLLHLTQSVLARGIEIKISVEDVATLKGQRKLFKRLLGKINSGDQLLLLKDVLMSWPQSQHSLHDCWVHLLCAFGRSRSTVLHTLPMRCVLTDVSEQEDEQLCAELLKTNPTEAMKVAAVSKSEHLMSTTLQSYQPEENVDINLMELMICKKKVAQVASTPLYISLCDYLRRGHGRDEVDKNLFATVLQCSSSEVIEKLLLCNLSLRIDDVVKQLKSEKKTIEAISLKLSASGVHSKLLTVNSLL